MVKHAGDVTQHWSRQNLDQHYTDQHHKHLSAWLTQADTWHARIFLRLSVSVYLCVCDLMISPKRDYQRDLKYQQIYLPLRGSRNSVCVGGAGGGVEETEDSVKPPAMLTLLRERSSVLTGTAFSATHPFHPALQIYDLSLTHTHHHSCCIVGLRQNVQCVHRHNEFICALLNISACMFSYRLILCELCMYVYEVCACVQEVKDRDTDRRGTMHITERSHMHMHTNIKAVKGVLGVMDERGNTINFAGD